MGFSWGESQLQLGQFFPWPSVASNYRRSVWWHRAPLSPRSPTHEPWPLILHMWVRDAVTMATVVCSEAFARCPWIARLIFSWVCLWVCKDDGCRRVWAETWMHHECIGLYLSEDRLHVLVWSLLGQWGLCLSEKISVTHLSSCFPSTRLFWH